MPATTGLLFRRYVRIELNLWRRTLFEAVTLVIMVLVILLNPIAHSKRLLYSRSEKSNEQTIVSHKMGDINILTQMSDAKREKTKFVLAYTPSVPFAKEMTDSVAETLELGGTVPYKSEDIMQDQFDDRTTLAGVVYYGLETEGTPLALSISIRFPSEFRTISPFLTEDRLWLTRCSGKVRPGRDRALDRDKEQDIYIREGFLQLQHQLFVKWYHRLRNEFASDYQEPNVEVYNILLKAADEPCSVMSVQRLPTFLFNFIYLLPFLNIIRNVANQCDDGVMVHQWHYGYSFGKQWSLKFLVLYLRLVCFGVLFVALVLIIWAYGPTEGELTSWSTLGLLCFILVYTVELLITAMVVAKIFSNSQNAVLFALVLWLFMYAAFCIMLERYWVIQKYYVFFLLLSFFNCQMHFGMTLFGLLFEQPDMVRVIDFVVLFTAAISSALIYLLILLAVQWKFPGQFLSRRIVNNRQRKASKSDDTIMYLGRVPSWENFEYGDVGSVELMRLRHVCTTHEESERKILKNISMRIYSGEVYVVLGHIGAGKLTLLRVMAGLKFPLKGTVMVMGKPFGPKETTRRLVDFRFDEHGLNKHLTVEQTIDYHVRLKLSPNDMDRFQIERRKWLAILEHFVPNRRARIGHLGLGARRLVALCVCLSGDTKIIILEEPTLGLTAREAQTFWTVVNSEKDNRAFVVGTYSVGEAEHIADRIGILSMGVLEASGTPFFLRAKFSSTVDLVIIKKPHVPDQPITDFINQFLQQVEPENEIGDTLTYRLPVRHRPKLQKLLIHLEIERKKLGIENVRVVGAELSDIYMKLSNSYRLQQQIIPDVTQTFKYQVVSERQLARQRMRAMFYKKMIHTAPNVWPIIMIITSIVLIAIIARLSVLLDVPVSRTNAIPLGIRNEEEVISSIPNLKKCGYINIKTHKKSAVKKAISNTFNKDSFACKKGSYLKALRHRTELRNLGAVEADGNHELKGYISQDIFHSAPMVLNLLHNVMLKLTYENRTDLLYEVSNHPMPTPLSMKINLVDNKLAHIHAPLAVGCILPLTVSVFVIPLVEEEIYSMRFMQHMAGLGLKIYWGINLFWDWFTFLIYSIIMVVIMGIMGIGGFPFYENCLVVLLMTVFGLAALPMTYLVAMYVSESMVRAFLVSVLVQGVSGLVLYIIYWDVANSNDIFFYSASLSPGFSMLDGISNLYTQSLELSLCRSKCDAHETCTQENMHEVVPHCRFDTYFKYTSPGILPAITFMALSALISLLLMFWIELHRREKKFHSSRDLHKMRSSAYPFDDGDVADVKLKIAEADMTKCKQSVFLVDQVEARIPPTGNRINTISFALNKYMSMGIFGPRNCGKSHLIRQLVGREGFAFGEIYVRGLDFKYDLESIHTYMGYCPQRNGLLKDLTPREHIRLLCMIRGVPERKIGEKMHDLCLMLNMTGWMHRKCGLLTAEKRQKVKIALALVAHNKVLVFDEPTCGMPATTKREIWNILRYLRYCGKTIIFATNDELECKVLADFIILFSDSEMLAIGSLQYLRYKYSHGFYLEVRLIRDGETIAESEENLRKDVENLAKFVNFLHNRSELVGRLQNWLKYYVPVGHIVYSFLYGAMEKNKVRLNVFDYCIYQADMNNVVAQVQITRAELKYRLIHNDGMPPEVHHKSKGKKGWKK
ncbi:hypothetical protein KR009_012306 [Drosophila setifemur]|nr:hypothetical protein KR009_012306 [Drosophila setifemur]